MRAAIYARRSTEEHQAESLETQVDNAQRFAAARGWTVDPAHVYLDTASRAEFVNRPGFVALGRAGLERAFEVLVTRDDSRLGGDMLRVATFAQELTDAGVRILFYATGEEMTLTDETSRLIAVVRGFASESERRKISSRTRENLERKARRGLVAGGVVFGYVNAPAPEGQGRVRVVDPDQAETVRSIFRWYAQGDGLRTICKRLNDRGTPSPRAGRRGLGTWVPSVVREMLRRPLYAGRIEWGKTHKLYRGGTKARTTEHGCELITVDAPHLRIVPDELWSRVRTKTATAAERKSPGRPMTYLLSGLLRCGDCAGPLTVAHGRDGTEPIKVYTCQRRRDRGQTACSASVRRDVRAVEAAVWAWVTERILTDTWVAKAAQELRRRAKARADATRGRLGELELEAEQLRRQEAALVDSIAVAPPEARVALCEGLGARRARLTALEVELRTARTLPGAIELEARRIERDVLARLKGLRGLERAPGAARKLLAEVFPTGLVATPEETPEGRRMRLDGWAADGQALIVKWASPAGTEPLPSAPERRGEPVTMSA